MSATSAGAPLDDVERATVHVRVTSPADAPALVDFLERLGLRALAGVDGAIRVRPWAGVEWHQARVEIFACIDSWVRQHGVPVQLI